MKAESPSCVEWEPCCVVPEQGIARDSPDGILPAAWRNSDGKGGSDFSHVKPFFHSPSKSCPCSPSSPPEVRRILRSELFPNHSDQRKRAHYSPQSSPFSTLEECETSRSGLPAGYHGNRVVLNVGGVVYETTLDTILKDPNSYFAAMWRHRNPEGERLFWLDRDGNRFADVLNFLRNGTVWLNDIPSLMSLREEAMYFQLPQLQDLCEEKIGEIKASKEREKNEFITQLKTSLVTSFANSSTYPFGINSSFSKDMETVFCTDEDF